MQPIPEYILKASIRTEDSGVVDQHIQPAKGTINLGPYLLNAVPVGNVKLVRQDLQSLPFQVSRCGLPFGQVTRTQEHSITALGQLTANF
jgi:hypothetical protein